MDITNKLQTSKYSKNNAVLKWLPGDTEQDFLDRLKKDPTNPSLLYYLENPISYRLNNYGFRTPIDFVNGVEGNLFLGCSHTFGIGHHLENTWSWKLNEYIGGNFLNLSVGGTGIGTAFRLLYGLKEIIKPKNVFLYFPHPYRFEYFDPRQNRWNTTMSAWNPNNRLIVEKNNMEMFYHLHFNAIQSICKELNTPLYAVNHYIGPKDGRKHVTFPDCAREVHSSPSAHISLFEVFKEVYNSKAEPYSKPIVFDKPKNLI